MRLALASVAVLLVLAPAAQAAAFPRGQTLSNGWEVHNQPAAPAQPQPPPPTEGAPEETPTPPTTVSPSPSEGPATWTPTAIPSVFNTQAVASEYGGWVQRYRLSITGPPTPPGFRWLLQFEEVRRIAAVYLNGRRLGHNTDPYTPFTLEARGLRPGRTNQLVVVVDSRKDPDIPEGWWNWGGIVRPVRLIPAGVGHILDLGTMSQVRCKGPARTCKASLLIDGVLERHGVKQLRPTLEVDLRSPSGRRTKRVFRLHRQRGKRHRIDVSVRVPAPILWKPEDPELYSARITLRDRGVVQQVERRTVGLRSVQVKGGQLYLNNRLLKLHGASIHEDMPGHGAALTPADMDRIVSDLKELGANVTRSHYVLSQALLSRLDRAGIMVWAQSPIWQRDRHHNLLSQAKERKRAWETVRRTVIAARSHPSVITHSVANELWSAPDDRPTTTQRYLLKAREIAHNLDPTLPISVDIVGNPSVSEQFTYHQFDMLGINEYFGWYGSVPNFADLAPYMQQMRDFYPELALVATEFGAEARPELATAPVTQKGSYAFQADYAARNIDTLEQAPISGEIYWTLREFNIYPGWLGGAGQRPLQYRPNTMHMKGLLTYEGDKKPAWYVVHDRYAALPTYPSP